MHIQPSVHVGQVEPQSTGAATPQAKPHAAPEPAATVHFSEAAVRAASGKADADGDGDKK